jgi:hypothetical protein
MVRTMVQLTEEQARALKAIAKARKVSVAKLVRESVAVYVAIAAKDPEHMKKKRRALAGLQKIAMLQEKRIYPSITTNTLKRSIHHDLRGHFSLCCTDKYG